MINLLLVCNDWWMSVYEHWQLHIENESKTKLVIAKFCDKQELIILVWRHPQSDDSNSKELGAVIMEQTVTNQMSKTNRKRLAHTPCCHARQHEFEIDVNKDIGILWGNFDCAKSTVISQSKLCSMSALCLCNQKQLIALMKASFQRALPCFRLRNQNFRSR